MLKPLSRPFSQNQELSPQRTQTGFSNPEIKIGSLGPTGSYIIFIFSSLYAGLKI
jgi:hypothetical protein